jgi:CheY-like chemotaxis protein
MSAATGKKILVVDDHELCRLVVRTILEDVFEVAEAECSDEALELVETWHPDLVIQDIARPGIDGYEFLTLLKKSHPSLPVIILTAYIDRQRSLDAGAFAHLFKPLADRDAILNIVNAALSNSRAASPLDR